ncbi:MAG: ABC transporter ATP-binding protein/permease, partial [Hyphomicrobiaceae bacterium]
MQQLNAPTSPSAGWRHRILKALTPDPARHRVLRGLVPYIWPHERPDLQRTVMFSLGLMLMAKLVTVMMPFTFKWATDALVAASGGRTNGAEVGFWLIGAPVTATLLYGLSRIIMTALMQLREGLFAKVAMHAVRKMALKAFEHMHRLSLRFHLERKTGGLTRVLERGREGIERLTRMTLMTFLPTIVEFLLVVGVCLIEFDWRYVVTIGVMVALYLWFTFWATEWRMSIRRTMNESDTDANTKAVDSLLNYETVKYFGAEARETARYDRSLVVYEQAGIGTYTSLSLLNTGQGVIFTLGLTTCLVMSAIDVVGGSNSVGHFAMVNLIFLQLFVPLNFMGTMYREIKQSLLDIEHMMDILDQNPEVEDRPGARPLEISGATIRFENVSFRYEADRPILRDLSFEVPAGRMVAIVGPSGAGKSTISRILMRFYDISGGRVTIDGQDIRYVTQRSLRETIGVVPQDTVLFNDNIRYNIQYGRADANPEEVEAA